MTGTIILIIGVSLMRVGGGLVRWRPGRRRGVRLPAAVGMGFFTLLVIIAIERFAPESLRRCRFCLGLLIGTVVAIPFDMDRWSHMGDYDWIGSSPRSSFGCPPSRSARSSRC